ncbi:MAG: hypothetical protein WC477_07260 [Patescibacteria group bacterium]
MNPSKAGGRDSFESRIIEVLEEYLEDAPFLKNFSSARHVHNGIDSLRVEQKNIDGQVLHPNQYALSATYTSASGAVTIKPGFTPKMILCSGSANNTTSSIYLMSNGHAGVMDPIVGNCSYHTIDIGGGGLYDVGRNSGAIVGSASVYCVVSSWSRDSVVITPTVPANWSLYVNFLVLG